MVIGVTSSCALGPFACVWRVAWITRQLGGLTGCFLGCSAMDPTVSVSLH